MGLTGTENPGKVLIGSPGHCPLSPGEESAPMRRPALGILLGAILLVPQQSFRSFYSHEWAGDPNFRDMWRGLLPLFANAIFLGPNF